MKENPPAVVTANGLEVVDKNDPDSRNRNSSSVHRQEAVEPNSENSNNSLKGIFDEPYWRQPRQLDATILGQEYPLEALPVMLRSAVIEVQRFVQAPIPLVAASAIAAVSVAVQPYVNVERAKNLSGPCSLYFMSLGGSGERKSTCDGYFTVPIKNYEAQQLEAAKPHLKKYEAAHASWLAHEAGIKEGIKSLAKAGKPVTEKEAALCELYGRKPVPPKYARMLRGDETPENLAWVLWQEWPSAAVLVSEAGLVLGSHGMGAETMMRNLGQFNAIWDGADLSIGRKTSQSFTVRGARLTIGLMVQEPTLHSFFDKSKGLARGMGFFARFLLSWPASTQGTRVFTEPPDTWPARANFNARMASILNHPVPMNANGELTPTMLTLSPEAKSLWVEFHNAIERDLAPNRALFDVRDVASKSADNAARLAALFHAFEYGPSGEIGPDAMASATQIAGWHLKEAQRFFGELTIPTELINATKLDDWLVKRCIKEGALCIPTTAVQRYGPNCIRDKKSLDAAASVLEQSHRARIRMDKGRTRYVEINPKLVLDAVRPWGTPWGTPTNT